jgi:hypothetical protein
MMCAGSSDEAILSVREAVRGGHSSHLEQRPVLQRGELSYLEGRQDPLCKLLVSSILALADAVDQDHFNNIMKEVPPAFVPPRKYNTAKRRAEEAAIASGAMPAPKKETRGSVGGSEEPEGDFESGEEEFEEAYGSPGGYGGPAPFDLPVGLNGRSREMTPAGGVPFAASSGFGYPAALSLNNQSFQPPPQQYVTPSFNPRNSTPLQQQLIYPPVNGNGPLHPPAPAPEPVTAVLVSKMPARHESSRSSPLPFPSSSTDAVLCRDPLLPNRPPLVQLHHPHERDSPTTLNRPPLSRHQHQSRSPPLPIHPSPDHRDPREESQVRTGGISIRPLSILHHPSFRC